MASTTVKPVVVELVLERDGGRCTRCGIYVLHGERGRDWSIHHRRPRGSGGTRIAWVNLPANCIVLCGSGTTGCHGWVESHRAAALELGYLVPLNGFRIAADTIIHHALHGVVVLDDTGSYERRAA